MGSSNYVHLDFDAIVRETDKALLVRFKGGREEWLPLSQIADSDDYRAGDKNGTISVTEWLANQKSLS